MLMAIDNRSPVFLKAVYPQPIKLLDHERHIPSGRKYITFDGAFRVWRMTPQRVPIPLGRCSDIHCAMYLARK